MLDRPPWSDRHAHLHQTLRSRHLLPAGARLLVAVSGGQDSVCLLRLLLDLQRLWNWSVVVAHCNHGWRSDATANAQFVIELARAWQVPCVVSQWDNPETTEAAARRWRYAALGSLARAENCPIVVTGHTASDRAETLLHHLIRGSGREGLGSLTWQRETEWGQLVRPLLDWTRDWTAEFCHEGNLPLWLDSTNDDCHYTRNRLRAEVIPLLRSRFNPQVERHLAQTADLLQEEAAWLASLSASWLAAHVDQADRLDRQALRAEHLALQRRAIRQWLGERSGRSPTYSQVMAVMALVDAPNRSQTESFAGGAQVVANDRWLEWLPPAAPNP